MNHLPAPSDMPLPGDLVARLRDLAEHDRVTLVGVLRTVDQPALKLALRCRPGTPESMSPVDGWHDRRPEQLPH